MFFIILAILGPLLPFLFGRIMVIETFVSVGVTDPLLLLHFLIFEQGQRTAYREILITGDLSQEDVDHANAQLWAVQVSLLLGFGLPVLIWCPGLCPNLALAPIWHKHIWRRRVHLQKRNHLLRPTKSIAVHPWRPRVRDF